MSSMIELPKWLRFFNISAGIVIVILAIISLIFISGNFQTLIIVLAIALIVIGVFRILNGIFLQYIEWYSRALKISIGILVLPLAIAILALSNIFTANIVSLLAIALILSSIARINVSSALLEYPDWYKVLTIVIGIVSIVTAGIVLLFQSIADYTLVALLAITFFFIGTGWIYAGIKEIEEA